MNKRLLRFFSLVFVMMIMTTQVAFGGTFNFEKSSPKESSKGVPVDNSSVKLYFDKKIYNPDNAEKNSKCFKLTDEKGKKVPLKILYSEKEDGMVLVLVDGKRLKEKTKYKLEVSGDLKAENGDVLGKDLVIHYETVDPSSTMMGSMAMMAIMMIGAVVYSAHAMKKEARREEEEKILNAKINPYKIAKQTGKSVEEIIEQDRKEKEKKRKKLEKKKAKEIVVDDDYEDFLKEENFNKKVKAPRGASKVDSLYVKQLRAKKEALEKDEEARRKAGTTNPKKKGKKKK